MLLLLFFTTDAGAAAVIGRKEKMDDIAMWIFMIYMCVYIARARYMRARVKKKRKEKDFLRKP